MVEIKKYYNIQFDKIIETPQDKIDSSDFIICIKYIQFKFIEIEIISNDNCMKGIGYLKLTKKLENLKPDLKDNKIYFEPKVDILEIILSIFTSFEF